MIPFSSVYGYFCLNGLVGWLTPFLSLYVLFYHLSLWMFCLGNLSCVVASLCYLFEDLRTNKRTKKSFIMLVILSQRCSRLNKKICMTLLRVLSVLPPPDPSALPLPTPSPFISPGYWCLLSYLAHKSLFSWFRLSTQKVNMVQVEGWRKWRLRLRLLRKKVRSSRRQRREAEIVETKKEAKIGKTWEEQIEVLERKKPRSKKSKSTRVQQKIKMVYWNRQNRTKNQDCLFL